MSVEDRKNMNCAAHNRKINIVDMDYVGEVKNILSSIPAGLEDKKQLFLSLNYDLTTGANLQALCIALIRLQHFPEEAGYQSWVKENLKIKDSTEISHKSRVGNMIYHFRDNPEVFTFLMAFQFTKNAAIASIEPARLDEFFKRYSPDYLADVSRDDLRALADRFQNKHKARKPEGENLIQPDLFGYLVKGARKSDPEEFNRLAERIVKKKRSASAVYAAGSIGGMIAAPCFHAEDASSAAIKAARLNLEAAAARLAELEAEAVKREAGTSEASDALPVKSEAAPPAVRRERREVTAEDLNDKQRLCRDQRYLFVKSVYDKVLAGMSPEAAAQETDAEGGARLEIARTYGRQSAGVLTLRNYYSWLSLLGRDEAGVPDWSNNIALAPRQTGRRSLGKQGPEEFWKILNGIYQQRNQLGIPECYRLAVKHYRANYPESREALPSENHCRYHLKQENPCIAILKREGESAFKNKVAPYIRRDWSQVKINQCWYADNRKFDVMVREWNEDKGCWIAVRPWICAFTDAKSWKYVGFRIATGSIDSRLVINTFAEAVYHNGEPESVYFDNGGDFQKTGFGTPVKFKPDGPEFSILGALGIRLHTAAPYNGRAKTVERIFGYQSRTFDKRFAAYLGNTPLVRPENAAMYAKTENVMALPTLQQFTECFKRWLSDYHNRPNRGRIINGRILGAGEPGMSPEQAYGILPKAARPARSMEEYKTLFRLPLPELRTVQRGGCVSVDKELYCSDALYEYLGRGRCIMVKLDLQDKNHVYAYTPDGKLIAECVRAGMVPALAESAEDKALLESAMKREKEVLRDTKQAAAELTGGQFDKFSVEQLEQATPEQFRTLADGRARLRIEGEYHSVKGDHNAKIYRLPGSDPLPENKPRPPMPEELDSRENAERRELLAGMYDD